LLNYLSQEDEFVEDVGVGQNCLQKQIQTIFISPFGRSIGKAVAEKVLEHLLKDNNLILVLDLFLLFNEFHKAGCDLVLGLHIEVSLVEPQALYQNAIVFALIGAEFKVLLIL
jgi:hypothetical protein